MNPRIDTEFQSLVHPLTHEEKAGLEQQLLTDGCLDPLRVWQEENILLDGHNRFDLCMLHNIPFKVEYISLKNRDSAMLWIVCNQLSRRNSTEEQKSYLRGKRYELEKRQQGGTGANQHKEQRDQNDLSAKTAEKIAKEFNVSAPTIKRDEQFAKGVDAIAKVAPEVKQEILAGKSELTKREVRSMATAKKQAEREVRSQTILTTEADIQKRIEEESKLRAQKQLQELYEKRRKREEQKQKREEIARSLETASDESLRSLEKIETKYRVIYADPPWKYGNDQTQAMPGSTRPEDHYITMSTFEICQLPIKSLALNDAVLFLWGTSPLLEDALQVIKAWGFTYKTTFIWDKIKHNFGHYNSVRHEILFVATRGSCTPDNKTLYDSVQSIERTEHSRKPERFREIIEDLYHFGNKLELFSRQPAKGWDSWGNEA